MNRSELIAARDEALEMLMIVYRKVVRDGLYDEDSAARAGVYSETHQSLCKQLEQESIVDAEAARPIYFMDVVEVLEEWAHDEPQLEARIKPIIEKVMFIGRKGGVS